MVFGRVNSNRPRSGRSTWLSQEPREIFFFPATSAAIPREFAFPLVEFFRVHPAAATRVSLVRHYRMQHFVIKNVTEEPPRNELLIQQRIDPDHAIFLLD